MLRFYYIDASAPRTLHHFITFVVLTFIIILIFDDMSHQDNIEASQSLVDTLQTCETKSLSSMCSESPDCEGELKSSTSLPDSPNVPERAEDTHSTSGTLDPNNQSTQTDFECVLKSSTSLPDSPKVPEDTLSTSGTLDLNNQSTQTDFECVLKSSTTLPGSPNVPESAEDTHSTSGTLDPNNHVVVFEQPHSRAEANSLVLSRDDLASPCRLSESDASTGDSSDWIFTPHPPPCGILGRCYREYEYRILMCRSKGYLLPLEIICLVFTIGCCFMGAYNWPLCPADGNIPRYVFFNGALATFSVCMLIVYSLWKIVIDPETGEAIYFCAFGFGWVAILTTLIEMAEFYTMSYSFHRVEANYCNEAFYRFVHYKNIAFGVAMALTAMIYMPGFRIYRNSDGMLPLINSFISENLIAVY